ncbi:MAG TPA: ABC transporter ATP-binding protein, partial [Pseudolabrys sp.]|nr:ABC transporter ATP-binding protein [Pseudolabrys sp.]
ARTLARHELMAFLSLEGLSKRFGTHTAVDGLTLGVEKGEFVSLLGPSGCGKTTTLRLIAGFVEPSAGEIAVGDRVVSSTARTLPPEQRNMSMIFQSYALWPHMTVTENVAYGLTLRKLDKALIASKVQTILAVTKLEALAARYPGELSGGQQQRVALARALIVEPETLLLDEPLSNLDANLREEMRFEVRRLHDEYRYTTVYVTHDQSEAMTTADLICVMNGGKIEQSGPPEEIYDRPSSEFVARFIGSSNVIRGKGLDGSSVDLAGTPLKCSGAKISLGAATPVSIRPHDIAISATQRQGENVVPATVVRQVFLGGSRDYMVEAKDGTQLRVLTGAGENIPQGSAVWLYLPPERCRALSG